MGWLADKWEQTNALLQEAIGPSIPPGESLVGCVHATRPSSFSSKQYALGVTDRHLLIQQVDRRMRPVGDAVVATADDLTVGNIFSDGAMWTLSDKDQQIRFEAKGEKYKFLVLGGTLFENALAGEGQIDGLQALVGFLRTAPR